MSINATTGQPFPRGAVPSPRHALLVNPFYAKDPHASFGKHVLTPTLALTSFAGATPPGWALRYWDENLLQGPPPADPFPQVVAITVHLTFAARAFELARWYLALAMDATDAQLHYPAACKGSWGASLVWQLTGDPATLDNFITFHADYDVPPLVSDAEHGKWVEEPPDLSISSPDASDTVTLEQ